MFLQHNTVFTSSNHSHNRKISEGVFVQSLVREELSIIERSGRQVANVRSLENGGQFGVGFSSLTSKSIGTPYNGLDKTAVKLMHGASRKAGLSLVPVQFTWAQLSLPSAHRIMPCARHAPIRFRGSATMCARVWACRPVRLESTVIGLSICVNEPNLLSDSYIIVPCPSKFQRGF